MIRKLVACHAAWHDDVGKEERDVIVLLEEFERASNEENNPESAGFFSRVKDFFEGALGEK